MNSYGQRRRPLVVTAAGITALAIVVSGCGNDGDLEQASGEPENEPVSAEAGSEQEPAAGESAAADREVNPCGPDGDGELPGPPGEAPADDATPVTLTAVEYAFEDAGSSYSAGDYAFTLSNEGAELHEVVLVRILGEETNLDDLMAMSDEEAEAAIEFVGGAIACPGDTAEPFGAALESGRYVMACFLPVGSTADADIEQLDGPEHAEQGMVVEMTVD